MNFSSQGKQLFIDDFKSSLEGLNKSNRWVQLGDTLPWDEIEKLYNKRLARIAAQVFRCVKLSTLSR